MLNNSQIKLVKVAAKQAGFWNPKGDCLDNGRYYLLLGQYKQGNGRKVTSCKQLNNIQLDDFLAICESHGWRQPGKPEDFYRQKSLEVFSRASFAQRKAIDYLAGDLGWNALQVLGMVERVTGGTCSDMAKLTSAQAFKVIEAMKAMFGRERGKQYSNLKQVQEDMEVTDGKKTRQVG